MAEEMTHTRLCLIIIAYCFWIIIGLLVVLCGVIIGANHAPEHQMILLLEQLIVIPVAAGRLCLLLILRYLSLMELFSARR